jgi:hypothetical protein
MAPVGPTGQRNLAVLILGAVFMAMLYAGSFVAEIAAPIGIITTVGLVAFGLQIGMGITRADIEDPNGSSALRVKDSKRKVRQNESEIDVSATIKNIGEEPITNESATVTLLSDGSPFCARTISVGEIQSSGSSFVEVTFETDPSTISGHRIIF